MLFLKPSDCPGAKRVLTDELFETGSMRLIGCARNLACQPGRDLRPNYFCIRPLMSAGSATSVSLNSRHSDTCW